ncbi:MAG: potassium/proton antiporter [Paludibacteraceae bacterium]|nr:potassium/proton antiporter [Paludibacteraceae bacterium]
MSIEFILLIISILFLLSIIVGKASSRFGVPALLLFLCIGMIFGSGGFGIEFNNFSIAQIIGTVALCIILFSGGMDTNIEEIRPVMKQGVLLATLGVFLTALITGLLIWLVLGMTFKSASIGLLTSLLLASTMSSTDSASVFSILRSKDLHLRNNLRPMLELESGSNDPMAYVLVITLIEVIKMDSSPNYWWAIGILVMQLCVGAIAGFVFGKLALHVINRLKIDNPSLYPILVFTFCIFIFSCTYFIKGNGYLAVYIGGLVIGNASFLHKRSSLRFFDGLAWLCQLLLFLTLGLLVNLNELLDVVVPGLIISFLMIFISRPISVFLSLAPFRKVGFRDKVYVSWCGLRGAVPIVFAILPLVADVPNAQFIFNIVFFCTLVSLLLQGTSLPMIAKWLHLDEKVTPKKILKDFDVDFPDEIKSVTTEITLTPEILQYGNHLMDLDLPDKTLVVMIKRSNKYFVPTGKTILHEKDKLLVITDDHEALTETYERLGVKK